MPLSSGWELCHRQKGSEPRRCAGEGTFLLTPGWSYLAPSRIQSPKETHSSLGRKSEIFEKSLNGMLLLYLLSLPPAKLSESVSCLMALSPVLSVVNLFPLSPSRAAFGRDTSWAEQSCRTLTELKETATEQQQRVSTTSTQMMWAWC